MAPKMIEANFKEEKQNKTKQNDKLIQIQSPTEKLLSKGSYGYCPVKK